MKQEEKINYGNERIEIKFTDRAGMLNNPENPPVQPNEVPTETPTEIPDPQPQHEIPEISPVEVPEINPVEIPEKQGAVPGSGIRY